MKINFFLLLRGLCLSLILLLPTHPAFGESKEIRFGSVAMDVPIAMHRRLDPLITYLSGALHTPVTLSLAPDMETVIDQVVHGDIDFAYLTPVAYVESYRRGGTKLVVRTVTNNKPFFQLMIVVKEGSPIQKISDLRGKSFAFGDKAAILQRAIVVQSGLSLGQLGEYEFLGHYDNIARGILNGDFDAGILKDTTALAWSGKGLRVLYTSPYLPPYNITASRHIDSGLIKLVRQALLKLDPSKPEERPVIKALDPSYDGFAPVRNQDYDIVRSLIAPFIESDDQD